MRTTITRNWELSVPILFLLFSGSFISSASATKPAKVVSGILSNIASALFKRLWSLKPTTKIGMAISSRSMVKLEGGYSVETVFDGSKLGIEPYSVEITPSGELLVLDSENSNIHKISTPLSKYSRPKLVAGSSEGYSGHVDGKPREARMNHPKGFTVDDRGNIYVADTINMAIRKISDAGVVTIAGGNGGRGPGHIDGPSDNAKFSKDFDVVYVQSSCSILVIDRGNHAIREIQLHDDDCSFSPFDANLDLGFAVLGAAVFFGYMLAMLQRRLSAMFSSPSDPRYVMNNVPQASYQTPIKSVRPPLIPPDYEQEKEEDGVFSSLGKLFTNTGSAVMEMFGGLFSSSKKKPFQPQQMNYRSTPSYSNPWPVQERYAIPYENAASSLVNREPLTRKSSQYMMQKPPEKIRHLKQSRYSYSGQTDMSFQQQQMQQLQQQHLHHHHRQCQQHRQKHYSSGPRTYYEENNETNNEIVFGAVQEEDEKRGSVVIKAVDYGNQNHYSTQDLRARYNYMGYAYGKY